MIKIWNGDANLANQLFGESYGVDWVYFKGSLDIIVGLRVIEVGDIIKRHERD